MKQNGTIILYMSDIFSYTPAGKQCVTLDEVKQLAKTIVQLIQKNHDELKADIEQLRNETAGIGHIVHTTVCMCQTRIIFQLL